MAEELEEGKKLAIYRLIVTRYKNLINEKESQSVSEIRQKVSPYNPVIKKLASKLSGGDGEKIIDSLDFFTYLQRTLLLVKKIKTCEFAFSFWLSYEEMLDLQVATKMDKAILLCSLLRAFGQESTVVVSKKGNNYVRFKMNEVVYLASSESGSLFSGEDVAKMLADDLLIYSFSDLIYENYE